MTHRTSKEGLYAFAALLLLLGCISFTEALTFKLQPNIRRCFVEEIPGDSNHEVVYKVTDAEGQKLHVSLTGPDGLDIWVDNKHEAKHKSYNTLGGEYSLCFLSKIYDQRATRNQPTTRTVTLKMGNDISEHQQKNPKRMLKPLEEQLRKIESAVLGIHNEYLFFKEKEEEMRATNEHMTSKVVWMSVLVILIFLVFSYFQLRHLKSYFRKKRMID